MTYKCLQPQAHGSLLVSATVCSTGRIFTRYLRYRSNIEFGRRVTSGLRSDVETPDDAAHHPILIQGAKSISHETSHLNHADEFKYYN